MRWRSIKSAPKDGRSVLLCRATDADNQPITGNAWGIFVQVAQWWEGEGWVVYCSLTQEPLLHFEPTHWMPIPRNPIAAQDPQA